MNGDPKSWFHARMNIFFKKIRTGQSLGNAPGQRHKRTSTERDDRQLLQSFESDRMNSSPELSSKSILLKDLTVPSDVYHSLDVTID
jgi:hypothetical protein